MEKGNLIKPTVPQLKDEYLLMIKEAILKENNLKVGDYILWDFDYQVVSSGYKRGEFNRFTHKKLCKGVLKEDENGFLFAESLEDLEFHETAYRDAAMRKSYYKRVMRRSKHYFGTGFIYTPR